MVTLFFTWVTWESANAEVRITKFRQFDIPHWSFDICLGGVEVLGEFDQLFDHLHRADGALSPKGARYASPGQRPGINRQEHPKP